MTATSSSLIGPSKTLNRLMQYEYYGYPRDFLADNKAVAAVTRADVLRVAKQVFAS